MKNKQTSREILTGWAAVALTVLAIVLFGLGFSTGYYIYGQMNSVVVTICYGGALLIECAAILCLKKFPKAFWPRLLTFLVTAGLAFGAVNLLGDRVEGIGNCILTDYDSGHGGEEAIYFSLGSVLAALAAMVFNIIGAFGRDAEEAKQTRGKKAGILGACALVCVAILVPSLILGGVFTSKGTGSAPVTAAGSSAPGLTGTYKATISGAEGNLEIMPGYQFQCGNLSGLMNYDTRLNLALELTLNPDNTYALFSDAYCVEAGKRAVIGDDTGLGMVSTMKAEGTYTVNEDGTVTTSPATHAVFTLELDTYSSQMRSPADYKIGEAEAADGTYDSADHPAVLDAVPATVWTLADGKITSYAKDTNVAGTYSVIISGAEGNLDIMPGHQFQCGNLSGLMNYDTRLNLALELTLNPDNTYALSSDAYCIEAGKRAVIGDDTGLGMVSTMKAEGTYTVSEDGVVTTSPATHAVFTLELDTYSSQMRSPANYKIGDAEAADGTYDSADHPAVLDAVPETVWTLSGSTITKYESTAVEEEQPAEEAAAEPVAEAPAAEAEPAAEKAAQEVTIVSDDGGTEMTFNPDGTYRFWFAAYSIEDLGAWTFENGVLTLTDKNGKTSSGEGDPIKLHYAYSASDQLTGDYTIPASTFAAPAAEAAAEPAAEATAAEAPAALLAEPTVIPSDDGGTEMTFNPDGTYRFWFAAYSIEDLGAWTYENGVLTLTDKNGKASSGEGDPIKLHYAYSGSDQLTGDYTIPASTFAK